MDEKTRRKLEESISSSCPSAAWRFEEVDDCGQEKIGSRWIVTKKEKADGQKSKSKRTFGG